MAILGSNMKLEKLTALNEKVSNLDGLLQKYMEKIESKIGRIWPEGRMGFTMPLPKELWTDDKSNNLTVYVDIGYKGKKASRVSPKGNNKYVIHINTNHAGSAANAMGIIAHEITHVSQYYNKFMDRTKTDKWQEFQDQLMSANSFKIYRDYYRRNHDKYPTEHEAVLVHVGYLLSRNEITDAMYKILNSPTYIKVFSYKAMLKKLAYLGVTNKQVQSLKKEIEKWALDTWDYRPMVTANPDTFLNRFRWYQDLNTLFSQMGIKTTKLRHWIKKAYEVIWKDFPWEDKKMKAKFDKVEKIVKKW